MADSYQISVTYPAQPSEHEPVSVFIRLLVMAFLAPIVVGLAAYLAPLYVAISVARHGAAGFRERHGAFFRDYLGYIVGLNAYTYFLADDMPDWAKPGSVSVDLHGEASPSVGSALLRYILNIPHFILLGILGYAAILLWFVAAIMVLLKKPIPEFVPDFMQRYCSYGARVVGYHASMTDEYPPFSF